MFFIFYTELVIIRNDDDGQRPGGPPRKLFKKIIQLLASRVAALFSFIFWGAVLETEVITKITSIVIKDPVRLRLTALVI